MQRLWAFALLLSMAGCSRSEESGPATGGAPFSARPSQVTSETPRTGRTLRVGVSLARRDAFDRAMQAAMEAVAQTDNVTLDIRSAEGDPTQQQRQVEAFVGAKVDAIVLCPIGNAAASLRSANTAHIPVFTAVSPGQGGTIRARIVPDDRQGGRLAARKLAELLKQRGNIMVIGLPAVSGGKDRIQGFKDEIVKHTGIKILAETPGGDRRETSRVQAQSALTRYGPQINGIFGGDDNASLGALDACMQAKRADVVIVGYDGSSEAHDAIHRGVNLKAAVVSDPDKIGGKAIDTVAASLRNLPIDPVVKVETGILDDSNRDRLPASGGE